MKATDLISLFILLCVLLVGIYFLWYNLPSETLDFEKFQGNLSGLSENSEQFYQNMRYVNKNIPYKMSEICSPKKQDDFERATKILEEKTILRLYKSDNPEIVVSCSNISPEPEEEGHFVAGEGGPAVIINTTRYSVILVGKIALYRPESCETPQVALHELLHALGFDHNNNSESIMYPYTDCGQKLDNYIIEEINRIYSAPPEADLAIESITANKTGRYLNFEATISNIGLKSSASPELTIYQYEEVIEKFPLEKIDIGAKRKLTVQNLRIPKDTLEIKFVVSSSETEITKDNNEVKIKII